MCRISLHSPADGRVDCLCILATVCHAAVSICVQCFYADVFLSFRRILRNGTAGSNGDQAINFSYEVFLLNHRCSNSPRSPVTADKLVNK